MIISTQEIHNVLDLVHTGPEALAVVRTPVMDRACLPFDAAPPVRTDFTVPNRLIACGSARGTAYSVAPMAATPEAPVYRPRHPVPLPILPGQDRQWRHSRVHDLRRQLADGRYSVVPDAVADKIIGRALCDQVSRLYDR